MKPPALSAVVLAGGAGRRLGGADKGLAMFRGRPLVAHVLERLRGQADEIFISANRNLDAYRALGYRVLQDATPDYPGPLEGLRGALAAARHAHLLCVPCDLPFLPADLAPRLMRALEAGDAQVAVAHAAGRAQPVVCLCRRDVLPSLHAYLAAGGRAVGRWQEGLRHVAVVFDDAGAFFNVNTERALED